MKRFHVTLIFLYRPPCRVDEHPPGDKAMKDFQDVLAYKLEQPRRRHAAKPSPKPDTKRPGNGKENCLSTKSAARPKGRETTGTKPSSTTNGDELEPCKETKNQEQHPTGSIEANPTVLPKKASPLPCDGDATDALVDDEHIEDCEMDVEKERHKKEAIDGTLVHPLRCDSRELVTPAVHRRPQHETPVTRPSAVFSERVAAVTDGQVHPTPMPLPTPATDPRSGGGGGVNSLSRERLQSSTKVGFKSPQPRQKTGAVGNVGNGSASPDVRTASLPAPRIQGSIIVPGGVATSAAGTMGTTDKAATAATITTRPPKASAPSGAKASGTKRKHAIREQHVATDDPPINIQRFGKGPVLYRPSSVPPLFKPAATARAATMQQPSWQASHVQVNIDAMRGFYTREKALTQVFNAGMPTTGAVFPSGSHGVSSCFAAETTRNQGAGMVENGPARPLGALLGQAVQRLQRS
jgi:hypothetical protein